MPVAGGAYDSVGNQQSPLRHAERHHRREEKGSHHRCARVLGCRPRNHAENRKNLRAHENKKNRIPDWHTQRSGLETRREVEIRSPGDLAMKILVITEQRQGKWNNTSFETLAAAQQIAAALSATVSALVIGKGLDTFAAELAGKNVSEVLQVEHDLIADYTPDGYGIALKQVIESAKADLVLFPHTYQVRDFAPKLAASLGNGMVGDCIGFRSEGGKLVFVRQMFQGKTVADVTFLADGPWFASFQSGAFRADQVTTAASGAKPIQKIAVELKAEQIRTKPLELFKEAKS